MADEDRSDRRSGSARHRGSPPARSSWGECHVSQPAYRRRSCYWGGARGDAARRRMCGPCSGPSVASSHSQSGRHPPVDQYAGRSTRGAACHLHLDCRLRPQPFSVLPRVIRERTGTAAQQAPGHGGSGYAIPCPGRDSCSGSNARSSGVRAQGDVVSAV